MRTEPPPSRQDSTVSTATSIPDLHVDADGHVVCGIDVEWVPLPRHLPDATITGPNVDATDNSALVRFDGITLLVRDGSRVMVDLHPPATREDALFALYGWAVSLIMLQRGHYFLHASVVARDSGAVAITGAKEGGKSTTGMGLNRRGWRIACDDTTPILIVEGRPWVVPFRRPVHLMPDRHWSEAEPVRALRFRGKSAYRMDQDLSPRPLTAVVEVAPVGGVREPRAMLVTGAEAIGLLERNLHARRATRTPLHRPRALTLLATIAGAVPIVRIERPAERDSLDEVCELIEGLPSVSGPLDVDPG